MSNFPVEYRTVGLIHSGHVLAEKTPIQPVYAGECREWVEIFPEFGEGLVLWSFSVGKEMCSLFAQWTYW